MIIGKNRHGRPETVHLAFQGDYSLFDNLDEFEARAANSFDSSPATPAPTMTSYDAPAPDAMPDLDDIPDDL